MILLLKDVITVKMDAAEAKAVTRALQAVVAMSDASGLSAAEVEIVSELHRKLVDEAAR